MKKFLKILGWTLAGIAVVAVVAYAWASWASARRYDRQWEVHDASFPIPFPLDEEEIAALREANPDADPAVEARDRAIARGRRLIETRLGCSACHQADFGGAALVDEPMVGRWVAPNLTIGKGGVTRAFTAADWDRAVRHGLRRGGRTSTMPSVDYTNLSDRELSNVVAYIRSRPPVDKDPGETAFGPVLKVMLALDQIELVAYRLDHRAPHAAEPPATAANATFGAHLAQACRGCHGERLSGGKIPGDPQMPIVANLTPHETGLADWSEADFIRALREGKRPDGSAISEFMPWKAYAQMSDTELRAIYAYLRTLPPTEKGNR